MPPRVDRLRVLAVLGGGFAATILWRAATVQLVEHRKWREAAVAQQFDEAVLLARRGTILDRSDVPLAESHELVQVAVAPREIPAPRRAEVTRALRAATTLRPTARQLATIGRGDDPWVPLPGVHYVRDLEAVRRLPGIHLEPAIRRTTAVPTSLLPVVGRVDATGRATDGLELAFDSLLQGVAGRGTFVRDRSRGQPFSPFSTVVDPRAGHDVVLTFHRALQELAERELLAGVRRHRATGGDALVMDALSGAVLAAVGVREGRVVPSATPLTEPYEPGSVLKPFVIAALLDRGRLAADSVVNTEGGRWTLEGRTFIDSHEADRMSVADIIRFSSNIGILKLVRGALTPAEEYALLRDLGLGAPTGVPYLGESSGRLPTIDRWTKWTWAQLVTGYEVQATPLQLAQMYTALANDGAMVEPALVREIRDPEGRPAWTHVRRPVRRVMSPATTRTIAGMLESVVDSGTATAAQLSRYAVAGKSGTARRAVGRRGYVAGRYNSSFVALFPADRPQLVVVVRMIDPTVPNSYGGATAGTVVRELLRGTLALPDILDRGGLREVVRPAPTTLARVTPADPTTTASAAGTLVPDHVADAPRPVLVLPDPPVEHQERRRVGEVGRRPDTPAPRTGAVPDVQGRTLREAVRALHGAGFRVVLTDAALGTTTPAAGRVLPAGALVQLGRGR